MIKYVIFDLDETLLKVNSHYYFARSFLDAKSRLLSIIYNIFSYGILGKLISYIKKDDSRRVISTFLFGFYSNDELYNHAKKIFKNWENFTNPNIYSLYKMAKAKKGYKIIIATATLDFIANVFEELTGIETISSTYHKGKIINDLKGKKAKKIAQFFQGELTMIVSDDFSDLTNDFSKKIFVIGNTIYTETTLESVASLL